jgi:UDP-glucose 4-epimerase
MAAATPTPSPRAANGPGPHGALRGQRVLVTGATGFIGARLCDALVAQGAQVHGIARSPAGRPSPGAGSFRAWQVDLADARATDRVVQDVRPSVVFHLASHVSGDRSLAAVAPTLRDNLLSTVNILTAACGGGVSRVVLAGSIEEPVGPEAPASPYAAAKAAAGGYARLFHALYGLPVVTLRVAMVYGPGQRDGTKLVPYVTRSLLTGEAPELTSGAREADWVYVDDVVGAFLAAALADADAVGGRAFDVGTGVLTSVRDVAERIADIVTRLGAFHAGPPVSPRFGAVADRPLEVRHAADPAPARRALGWTASTSLAGGLAQTVGWFRTQTRDRRVTVPERS